MPCRAVPRLRADEPRTCAQCERVRPRGIEACVRVWRGRGAGSGRRKCACACDEIDGSVDEDRTTRTTTLPLPQHADEQEAEEEEEEEEAVAIAPRFIAADRRDGAGIALASERPRLIAPTTESTTE